jgi:predicted deacetylase
MAHQELMVRPGNAAPGGAPATGAPPQPDGAARLLCLVLHGVSPATWALFRPLLREVDVLGGVPTSHLVSPGSRRGDSLGDDARFCAAMDGRLLRGDELVMSGYGPSPGDAGGEGADGQRVRGAGQGVAMAAPPTSEREAHLRLRSGLRQFMDLDWPVEGFIAPGWRLGHAVRAALRHLPFRYTGDREVLIALDDGRMRPAPTAVSIDLGAPWQAAFPKPRGSTAAARFDEAPCLRLAVHPMDLRHPDGRAFWFRTLDRMLSRRRPATLSECLGEAGGPTG